VAGIAKIDEIAADALYITPENPCWLDATEINRFVSMILGVLARNGIDGVAVEPVDRK
jgi:hypothetical protein